MPNGAYEGSAMVKACGKMELLIKMLPRDKQDMVLRVDVGDKIVAMSGAHFDKPVKDVAEDNDAPRPKERIKGRIKPVGSTSGLIEDRKGRRVLVQRTGSEEARTRNEDEAGGYGAPRRPTRGYKGKRDLKPQTDFTDD